MPTVREVTFDLLRKLDVKNFVANPGSTEETFLANFPKDFNFVMALQEASVVGIADGLSQGLKKPVVVNVHTGAGMGNAMGCILTARLNKTPLIITAGQQTRDMLLMEPFLTNREAIEFPKPWVKWSYEVMRPEDVPATFMRAYAMATQAPAGPVFVSIPLDLWNCSIDKADIYRTTSIKTAPDPDTISFFAKRINQSKNPVLIYGGDVARSGAWNEAIMLAERLGAPVWKGPFSELVSFPEDHGLFKGELPSGKGLLSQMLVDHDLVIVIGAPVFRYYPWIPGEYLPKGASLIQIIDDPYEAAKSPVGDSLISDSRLALKCLLDEVKDSHAPKNFSSQVKKKRSQAQVSPIYPLTAKEVFDVLSLDTPEDYVLVEESPSNSHEFQKSGIGTINKPDSFYAMSSGGLGWGMPASVGLALAERRNGRNRPVILIIGDGSFQYSVQSIWTAVQHKVHLIIVALRNEEYAILKSFALLEKTPNVPGLDLPGLDLVSLAKGYGAEACRADTIEEIQDAYQKALKRPGVSMIEIPINKKIHKLLGYIHIK
ncbi:benzoylformate decarboxylase [Legionella norrlandica]|uniref:Benzoylformate decarboxylase n=1 Tax=Legionella norrlandica TaxID=1498499 RepID=A0A0A2SSN1_9GAMM|nr:benzoylformate decarboxylase [Legionella norrlandica]KGP62399.1 benzoylformate decarboxylase [Legionella norrlandica]